MLLIPIIGRPDAGASPKLDSSPARRIPGTSLAPPASDIALRAGAYENALL